MPKTAPSPVLSGEPLTTATAEKVFGWKAVHKHNGQLVGKKQGKLGYEAARTLGAIPERAFQDHKSREAS